MGLAIIETQTAEPSAQFWTPMIRGVDLESEKTVSVLEQSVTAGAFDLRGNGLVIGRSLADRLGLKVGDSLAVSSAKHLHKVRQSRNGQQEEMPLPDDYEVRGIFDVGHYEYNSAYMLCSLANAQDLFDLGDGVQGLIVMLDDPERATEVGHRLQAHLGGGFTVTTWKEENAGILDALVVEKNVMFYLLFFITIVAAFGIASALITFVVQKTREIGLLKAIGATRVQIMTLFLVQSLVVGVVGVIAGFGLGLLAVGYRNEFLAFMRRTTGWSLFPPEIYNFNELPALVVPGDVALICGGSMVICLLAGLIPAWNAGRLLPVEALRHE
jgi:lipoprotein-releasing system permease protein